MGQATLAGRPMRLDPSGVQWSLSAKTNVTNTLGGRVVQVYGVEIGDMTVTGEFGVGGYDEQKGWLDYLASLTPSGVDIQDAAKAIRFIFPKKKWDFLVYLKSFTQSDSQSSVATSATLINPKWSMVFTIAQNNDQVQEAATTAFLAVLQRLKSGIGWKIDEFNGVGAI